MKSFKFGQTRMNLPILGYRTGGTGTRVLILGGVHGDEVEGVVGAHALLARMMEAHTLKLDVTIVPIFNPEGFFALDRQNSQGVDLNRNLPTNDWTNEVAQPRYFPGEAANSEPENQALVEWLDNNKPRLVISLHSFKKSMLNTNGNCTPEAELIHKFTGYEIHESIGYPTPGCLGTYSGLERDMPTLTYEFLKGMPTEQIIDQHVPAILEALKITEERY